MLVLSALDELNHSVFWIVQKPMPRIILISLRPPTMLFDLLRMPIYLGTCFLFHF
jgi:hypothetical protein